MSGIKNYLFLMLVVALVALLGSANAEVPSVINYQGRLTDSVGNPVANGQYNVTFKIWNDSVGEISLPAWIGTQQAVQVTNGLFNCPVGPIPSSVFTSGVEKYLGITVGTDDEIEPRTQLITVPYAYHAAIADTANFASSDADWTIAGDTIYRTTGNVGIGTSTPSEPLVVGNDVTSYPGTWAVIGDDTPGETTGLLIGENANNHSWLEWSINGNRLSLGTRESATWYLNTLNIKAGNVGIGTTSPSELLTVGDDLTYFSGNLITVGDADPTSYAGISFGQDADNRGWLAYDNEGDYLYLGTKENGVFSPNRICSKGGNFGIGIVPDGPKCLQIDRTSNLDPAENFYGVMSDVTSSNNNGDVYGGYFSATNGAFATTGIEAQAHPNNGYAAAGVFASVSGTATFKYGIYGSCGTSTCDYGIYSQGNLHSTGSNTKAAGGYRIDHPQDPENLYLMHSDVSSPEQKNVYEGTIVTDTDGNAVVELPSYFESLNENYRYQLTVIGAFAQAIISEKINGNRFGIKTDKPNVEVCWMVTGIRKDAFAKSVLSDIEVRKEDEEQGLYQNPEAFGFGFEKSVDYQLVQSRERDGK